MNKRTTKPSRIIVSGVALMLALLLILSIVFSAIRVFAQEGTSAAPVSETPSTSTTSSATDSTAKPIPSGKTESADSTSENKTEKPEPKPGELVKDEVIYSKLELDGSVRGVFVVNIFTSDKAERATDTGSYTNVQSLGGGTIDSWDGKQVTFSKEPGSFYYQGDLDKTSLPWTFKFRYTLDGKTITADQLAGSSGALDIHLDVAAGDAESKAFFDHYLMQITVTLPTDKAKNVVAPDAARAYSGESQVLTFATMPGKSASYTVKADVENFTMPAIQIAAVPFNMEIELPITMR